MPSPAPIAAICLTENASGVWNINSKTKTKIPSAARTTTAAPLTFSTIPQTSLSCVNYIEKLLTTKIPDTKNTDREHKFSVFFIIVLNLKIFFQHFGDLSLHRLEDALGAAVAVDKLLHIITFRAAGKVVT